MRTDLNWEGVSNSSLEIGNEKIEGTGRTTRNRVTVTENSCRK